MNFQSFKDLVEKINDDLKDLGEHLQEFRKKYHQLSRAAPKKLLANNLEEDENYTFHNGGKKEIQFNLGLESNYLRYGLAISLAPGQDIPDPIKTLKPFIDAFNNASKQECQGFKLFRNLEEVNGIEIREYELYDFWFFGKYINWNNGNLDDSDYEDIITTFRNLFPFYKKIMMEVKLMKKIQEDFEPLLVTNKQIIFTGAPGTGKTYTAKELAKSITGNQSFRYQFVQFHPSFDYTDFIEGLKPFKSTEDKELQFKMVNGIFKEFCRIAGIIERIKFVKEEVTKDDIEKFLPSNLGEKRDEIRNFWMNWLQENPDCNIENLPKFVFIIDEINRAEISNVFGELFFAIDPDYRGHKGLTKTQYSFMSTKETFFVDENDDYFFVPSNVYIIGTMNDIDRSVEVFDFAIRRRFVWYEIKANEVIDVILNNKLEIDNEIIEEAKNRLKKLNEYIDSIEGLDESYHIGPAYFLKIKNYANNEEEENKWEKLWKLHIEPLLKEYLRGMPNLDDRLDSLKKYYDLLERPENDGS